MLRVYENKEIPKGYRDTLRINSIDINEIKYIAIPDDEFRNIDEFLSKVVTERNCIVLSTIMDTSFYAFYKKKNE